MDLILWRHAEAEDGIPDLARQLTQRGRAQAQRVGGWLRQRLPSSTELLCSPAERCQQTAEAYSTTFTTLPELAPGASVRTLIKVAGWPRLDGCILLVSHQPTLGELASYLLCGEPMPWSIKKGAIWWITTRSKDRQTQAVLKAAVSPELL